MNKYLVGNFKIISRIISNVSRTPWDRFTHSLRIHAPKLGKPWYKCLSNFYINRKQLFNAWNVCLVQGPGHRYDNINISYYIIQTSRNRLPSEKFLFNSITNHIYKYSSSKVLIIFSMIIWNESLAFYFIFLVY